MTVGSGGLLDLNSPFLSLILSREFRHTRRYREINRVAADVSPGLITKQYQYYSMKQAASSTNSSLSVSVNIYTKGTLGIAVPTLVGSSPSPIIEISRRFQRFDELLCIRLEINHGEREVVGSSLLNVLRIESLIRA